jgi:O-acetyl-ADP-ribose deacetylase (regulator of RNase III)
MPAKRVIHTVGPVWRGGENNEDELLASCYRRSLETAVENGLKTVAFPAISCGVYGYPLERAAQVALAAVDSFLADDPPIELVRFVLFDDSACEAFQQALDEQAP